MIKAADVVIKPISAEKTENYFVKVEEVIGRKTKKTLNKMQIIEPQHLTKLADFRGSTCNTRKSDWSSERY